MIPRDKYNGTSTKNVNDMVSFTLLNATTLNSNIMEINLE